MRFCHIKEDYITFLRNYDTKVAENKNESRPYVGVVLQIGEICYYAPFTSPKAKHQKMKNGKDFRKIGQGKYGAINFNNMIPVPNSAILFMEIENETTPNINDCSRTNTMRSKRIGTISRERRKNCGNWS